MCIKEIIQKTGKFKIILDEYDKEDTFIINFMHPEFPLVPLNHSICMYSESGDIDELLKAMNSLEFIGDKNEEIKRIIIYTHFNKHEYENLFVDFNKRMSQNVIVFYDDY